jgi:hypothetical protein
VTDCLLWLCNHGGKCSQHSSTHHPEAKEKVEHSHELNITPFIVVNSNLLRPCSRELVLLHSTVLDTAGAATTTPPYRSSPIQKALPPVMFQARAFGDAGMSGHEQK